jgi:hypothetical protein
VTSFSPTKVLWRSKEQFEKIFSSKIIFQLKAGYFHAFPLEKRFMSFNIRAKQKGNFQKLK